jgi:hypothetical protein
MHKEELEKKTMLADAPQSSESTEMVSYLNFSSYMGGTKSDLCQKINLTPFEMIRDKSEHLSDLGIFNPGRARDFPQTLSLPTRLARKL